MPYCEIRTNVTVGKNKEMELSHALAKVIGQIPGKTEDWVMTSIQDGAVMSFAGTDEKPTALITLKTFGEPDGELYERLTAGFSKTVGGMLGIPEDRIYVIHEPVKYWGWNGRNF